MLQNKAVSWQARKRQAGAGRLTPWSPVEVNSAVVARVFLPGAADSQGAPGQRPTPRGGQAPGTGAAGRRRAGSGPAWPPMSPHLRQPCRSRGGNGWDRLVLTNLGFLPSATSSGQPRRPLPGGPFRRSPLFSRPPRSGGED